MIKKCGVVFATFPANGIQGPAALRNHKPENVDQHRHKKDKKLNI
jgi:hypothetical protein